MLDHVDVDQVREPGPAQRAGITLERVGEEAILLDGVAGRAHVLNGSAARLWELLGAPTAGGGRSGRRDREALTAAFAASYAVPADAVRDDVEAALRSFAALGVLA